MAWTTVLLRVAECGGRVARLAGDLCGHLGLPLLWRAPKTEGCGVRGQVVLPPPGGTFIEGRAAGLAPVTVAYERQGTGEPVVLLHGLGCQRQAWDPVVPLLTGHREIVAMDLPGFGWSPDLDPGVPRDLETAAAWLGSVFTALHVDRPHVVGHSLGGLIALHLGQAGLVRSVTALAPAGFWTAAERRYAYAMLTAAHNGVRLLPDAVLERLPHTAVARAALTGTLYGDPDLCPPEWVAMVLRALRDSVAFKATLRAGRAPNLFTGDIPDIPVTVAWGTRDRLLPPWQADRLRAMIPPARLVPLYGCGHVPMLDAPDLVARVILQATEPPHEAAASNPAPAGTDAP
ncbi:alpha/beta fold hydrolase [Streptomyces sp. SID2888]|uniref:alpha/beta fold hydrolase n=1 Tax=Streptomyces sp. SID2888 TaxID=2690256 RepID=UPI0013721AFC|nr:alpha/beta fold hydrolase [Streptomyces sp. SID2888]MYV44774.1 alpha/beta fold hydrolase [Streptomyces sp. SID2888]